MKKILIVFFLSASLTEAGTLSKSTVCPGISSEAGNVLNSIQGLKSQLKPLPECQSIQDKLNVVNTIMSGQKWKSISSVILSNTETNLEGDEIKAISQMTEEASYALNDIISQVSNNRKCLDDDSQTSFLSKLSGVVKVVSTIVGGVTGPYGMAVALGGNILSSAIAGIDKYQKENHPYKFSKFEEEMMFMNLFCSYAEIQKDINDYLNVGMRPEELTHLRGYLKTKQNDIKENCDDCGAIITAWNAKEKSDQILERIRQDVRIVEPSATELNGSFTRCNEINRAIYSDDSDLYQFFGLLAEYDNPLMSASDKSVIKDIVAASTQLPMIYPKLTVCWNLPQGDKQLVSRDFNSFLRDDILPLGQSIFGQQISAFQKMANKKYKNPLGDYTERTQNRLKWVNEELGKVGSIINDPNYESSVQAVIAQKNRLDKRFFDVLTYDYLKFLIKRNLKEYKRFNRSFKKFKKEGLKKYGPLLGVKLNSLNELVATMEKTSKVDKQLFFANLKDIRLGMDLVLTRAKTIDRYCHFMSYMQIISNRTDKLCRDFKTDFDEARLKSSGLDGYVKGFVESRFAWLPQDELTQISRVQDYSTHLKAWLDRGDERWELKPLIQD